jgi:hypothetical protein
MRLQIGLGKDMMLPGNQIGMRGMFRSASPIVSLPVATESKDRSMRPPSCQGESRPDRICFANDSRDLQFIWCPMRQSTRTEYAFNKNCCVEMWRQMRGSQNESNVATSSRRLAYTPTDISQAEVHTILTVRVQKTHEACGSGIRCLLQRVHPRSRVSSERGCANRPQQISFV